MSTVRPRTIINLAAGNSQMIVIKKAKEMGFRVIGVDRNPDAPGFELCDERIVLSTYDAWPIIEKIILLKERYHILGVINRSAGPPVVTCAELCDYFSLPGIRSEAARDIVNKAKFKTKCQRLGIPVPSGQAVESLADIDIPGISFPCVIKPALSFVGKSGVMVINQSDEISDAFLQAKQHSVNGWVIVEEFIAGRDVSLMAIVQRGRVFPLVLLDEINLINRRGEILGIGFAVPSVFTGRAEALSVVLLARSLVEVFALDTTILNMSCRVTAGGNLKLIEVHLDFGGDLILDHLIPCSTYSDILRLMIGSLTGEPVFLDNIILKPAALIFGEGEDPSSKRSFNLVHAETRKDLEDVIHQVREDRAYA